MSDAVSDRNRRAVYLALSGVFADQATLLRALQIWQDKFSEQRGFRVNLYVNAVAQDIVLDDAQVRLLASKLYAAMTTPERNLPPLPAALRGRFAGEPQPPTVVSPQDVVRQSASKQNVSTQDVSIQTGAVNPRLAVYTQLLAALIDGAVRAQKFEDFLAALESQEPELPRRVAQARTVWINGALTKLRDFVNVVPDNDRRAVVNDLYVALCDACGPVAADRILAAAVQTVEQSAEARFASPREFI